MIQMRVSLFMLSALLLLIAVAGITIGLHTSQVVHSLDAGILPLMVGTIALGALTIVLAVERSRSEQLKLLRELAGGKHTDARPRDPALAARRSRLAAEATSQPAESSLPR